ncbi:MAG: type II toxin-antitoxin system RelE/ParE family toxin [Bacteroidales bacterium]
MKVFWTKRARKSFDSILAFLLEEWGETSARKFLRLTFRLVELLKEHPHLGKEEKAIEGLRSFVLTRHTTIFYRIKDNKVIVLLKFSDIRQNPKKRLK